MCSKSLATYTILNIFGVDSILKNTTIINVLRDKWTNDNFVSSSTKIISYRFLIHSHTSFNVGKYNGYVYVPQ